MARIEDGTGQGNYAAVSETNRILVSAETTSSLAVASATRADAFVASTEQEVALTAGTSAILLVKNDSTQPLAVGNISASTDVECVVTLHRDPGTGGTIVSAGTAITPAQLNFGSSKQFAGEAYRGADGQTIGISTDIVALGRIQPGFVLLPLSGAIILNTSDTIGVTVTATAATNIIVNMTLGYLAG